MSRPGERGGLTARVSAAEQDRIAREERQASALRVLTERGEMDVAEILGLVHPLCQACGVRREDVDGSGYCTERSCRALAKAGAR